MTKEARWFPVILLIMIIWGSFFPVSKSIVADVHPLMLAVLRYLFAVVPMTPMFFVEIHRRRRPTWRDLGGIAALSIIGVTGFAILLYYSFSLTNAVAVSILSNTQPIFAIVFTPLLTLERFDRKQLLGVLLGVAGMVLVVTGGDFSGVTIGDRVVLGNVLSILAAMSISFFYIMLKRYVVKYGTVIPTFVSFVFGGSLLFAAALVAGAEPAQLANLSRRTWVGITYIGVVATAAVYLIHNAAIAAIGIIPTMTPKFLIPVFGATLSIIFLGEQATPAVLVGVGAVAAAILIVQLGHRRADPS